MITRVRWFTVGGLSRDSLETISKALLSSKFTPSSRHGFELKSVRPDTIEGKFIERLEAKERITDPFGQELEFLRLEFRQTAFTLSRATERLEIQDAPRGIREFLNQLSKASKRTITITPVELSVDEWIKRIVKGVRNLRVVSVLASDIPLSADASARLLVKGSEDVRERTADFIGDKAYNIERAEVVWGPQTKSNCCELLRDARANLISGSETEILAALRRTVAVNH